MKLTHKNCNTHLVVHDCIHKNCHTVLGEDLKRTMQISLSPFRLFYWRTSAPILISAREFFFIFYEFEKLSAYFKEEKEETNLEN
jgi:hypothetical protein